MYNNTREGRKTGWVWKVRLMQLRGNNAGQQRIGKLQIGRGAFFLRDRWIDRNRSLNFLLRIVAETTLKNISKPSLVTYLGFGIGLGPGGSARGMLEPRPMALTSKLMKKKFWNSTTMG